MEKDKVSVLIVNKANLIGSLLAVVLRQETNIGVVGIATAVDEAMALADKCDVMLVDVNLPKDGAITLAREVGRKRPHTHVLITGVEKKANTILKYIEAGASGYVLKEFTLAELVEQIQAIPEGKAFVEPEIVAELIERLSDLADMCADQATLQTAVDSLSPRETEVLNRLSEGKSNAEIGEELHIEVGTVKNHVHSILHKLGVSSRQQAAHLYEQAEKT